MVTMLELCDRRFMCELACDAQMLDHKFRRTFYNPKSRDFKDNLKRKFMLVVLPGLIQ